MKVKQKGSEMEQLRQEGKTCREIASAVSRLNTYLFVIEALGVAPDAIQLVFLHVRRALVCQLRECFTHFWCVAQPLEHLPSCQGYDECNALPKSGALYQLAQSLPQKHGFFDRNRAFTF